MEKAGPGASSSELLQLEGTVNVGHAQLDPRNQQDKAPFAWVRVMRGNYKGDIGKTYQFNAAAYNAVVKLVPRKAELDNKRREENGAELLKLEGVSFKKLADGNLKIGKEIFNPKGFLLKTIAVNSLVTHIVPSNKEREFFEEMEKLPDQVLHIGDDSHEKEESKEKKTALPDLLKELRPATYEGKVFNICSVDLGQIYLLSDDGTRAVILTTDLASLANMVDRKTFNEGDCIRLSVLKTNQDEKDWFAKHAASTFATGLQCYMRKKENEATSYLTRWFVTKITKTSAVLQALPEQKRGPPCINYKIRSRDNDLRVTMDVFDIVYLYYHPQ